MTQISGIFNIIRPLNGIVAAVSLLPALTLYAGDLRYDWHVGWVLFLLVSFGYVINDIYDVIGDRENDRRRPLASGQLTMLSARFVAGFLALLSIVLSTLYSVNLLIYDVVLLAALFGYAWYVSTRLAVANIWVAALCSSVFVLPMLIAKSDAGGEQCLLMSYAVVLSFLFHLAREIVKDIEDVRGDLLLKRATLPLVIGAKQSRLVAMAILLLMAVFSYYVYLQVGQVAYLLIVTIGVNLPTVLIFLIYLRRDPVKWAGNVSVVLKFLMLPALASLLALGLG